MRNSVILLFGAGYFKNLVNYWRSSQVQAEQQKLHERDVHKKNCESQELRIPGIANLELRIANFFVLIRVRVRKGLPSGRINHEPRCFYFAIRNSKFAILYGITRTGNCDTDGATLPIKLRIKLLAPEVGTSMMSLGISATSSARFFSIADRSTINSCLVALPGSCLTILTLSFLLSCFVPPAMAIARDNVIGSFSGIVI